MRLLTVAFAALALLAAPAAVAAECPRTTLGEIEKEVMCPVCGTPLALAEEAPQAQRQRALIERLIDDCRSKEEVKRVLVAEFGPQVLALPGDREGGFELSDWLVYLLPAVGLLLAAGGIAAAALRWRRQPGERAAPGAQGAAGSSRLDDDLDRYDL